MNSSKLSINRVCAVGAAFLGLLSAAAITAAFLFTRNPAIVWLGLLFILLVFICVALFVAFLRRKLVLFSDRLCENNTSFRRRKATKRTTQMNTSRINSRSSHTIAGFLVKRKAAVMVIMESKAKMAAPTAQARLMETFTSLSPQSTYSPCHRRS